MMIGTVGPNLPLDLLEATGRYAGPLAWQVGRPTPTADRWLESKFPQWAKSIVEDWAGGAFDHLETVLFSRADDAAQRLYYYLCELQRRGLVGGPRPLILDIAKIPRPSSEAHTIRAVRGLADSFAIEDAALEQAIAATNHRRGGEPAMAGAERICLLIGTPPPTDRLHAAITGAGFAAAGPTLAQLWSDPGPPVQENSGDPAAAIGRQVHARPDDQRGFQDEAAGALERARQTGAVAAVLWYTEEDEARVWTLTHIRDALAAAGLPLLIMARRDASAQDGASDEIDAFLNGVAA